MVDIKTSDEINQSIITRNPVEFYFEKFDLGINGEKLRGKKILDLGSGQSNFAETFNNKPELNATVVRLDAKYSDIKPSYLEEAVTGAAQFLPFADNSFDEVLASYSIYWIKDKLQQALTETIRVTRPGGMMQIYPVSVIGTQSLEGIPQTSVDYKEGEEESGYTLTITKDPNLTKEQWEEAVKGLCQKIDFSQKPEVKIPNKQEIAKRLRQSLQ